ncbi:DUF2383 domain-containing protein [Polyangium aurulentum]|uniref:DUF2383 domain-containing protein n=1 Tax=Polyangium aurulentum TaxID=2567896 RepID=UPI0010AE6BFA|nr:DUF2383 domain-containing protein [Polyangium aurulentum]UQA56365.1 PA2169 family four-helix-bundle protein [Polyangium aurulentum]
MNKKIVEKLNDLIQLDTDAVLAYQQAIVGCEVTEILDHLKRFQDDHQRHIGDLAELVRAAGEEPMIKRDLKGFLIEGFTAIASRGDRGALMAMLGNEELTNMRYEAALEMELPDEVRAVVERNREDERRHLEWIKEAVAGSFWDIKEGAAAIASGKKSAA